jgi:predicted dehydrogenase
MRQLNRRQFLGNSLAGTLAATSISSWAADADAPLKLGLIGCGWYGMVDVKAAFKVGGVEVVAICDADSAHLSASAGEIEKLQGKRPRTFKHYDELLQTPGLAAVIIATPPHWHALPFIAAVEHGLDVYCEKPLAYDIREGRAIVNAAKNSGRIVQIGFQRRHAAAIREARDYLQAGNAGRIIQADAQIHYQAGLKDATPQDPPATLDWDLWCGPGPMIPYSPQVGHFAWRLEQTSGHGHLVDWGIHLIDAARWILGETAPCSVTAAGGIYVFKGKITTPDVLTAQFDFERCPVTWRHRIWGAEEYAPEVSNGLFFYGEKATVFVTDNQWIVIPRGKGKDRQVHDLKSDPGTQHMQEFLECVRSRKQPGCAPEDAYHSTTTVKLAMIAYETGTRIEWDRQAEQIPNSPLAAKLLKRNYRAPYRHPYGA